jgi:hypothetical protein
MFEVLEGLPDGVIGIEAVGEVEAKDYDTVLTPVVEKALAAGGVRIVIVLGDRFTGYSAGAAWEDTKFGFEHLRGWKRTALVTDQGWASHMAGAFGWLVPGKFKHFSLAERDAAINWAAAD